MASFVSLAEVQRVSGGGLSSIALKKCLKKNYMNLGKCGP